MKVFHFPLNVNARAGAGICLNSIEINLVSIGKVGL